MRYVATGTIALAAVVMALAAPAALHAQDGTLDRIQNLTASGRFTEASNTLAQWEASYADPRSSATSADRARALFLRGVLSADAKEAEDAFVGVVLSYPSSASAPEALLRLGQGMLTAGEPRRAMGYLERLRSDYPGSPQREAGLLWLARAQLATGSAAAACSTAADAAAASASINMRTLLELERDRACAAGAQASASPFSAAPRPLPPPAAGAAAARNPNPGAAAAPAGDYAVQTGAYREISSAQNIASQMRTRGFDVRVVLVGDSPLHRVRFGRFATQEEATAASRRIRDAGFAIIIVNDVQSERR